MTEVSSSTWKLPSKLCALSGDLPWKLAVVQWRLDYIDMEGDTCLCNHPIYERCHIVNIENNATAILGNCCIKKITENRHFEKINNIFQALKRITENLHNAANPPLIRYALRKGIFSLQEAKSYRKKWRERNDDSNQFKLALNNRLIVQIKTHIKNTASEAALADYKHFESALESQEDSSPDVSLSQANATTNIAFAAMAARIGATSDDSDDDSTQLPARSSPSIRSSPSLSQTPARRFHPYLRTPTSSTGSYSPPPIRVARALSFPQSHDRRPSQLRHAAILPPVMPSAQQLDQPARLVPQPLIERAFEQNLVSQEDRDFYSRMHILQPLGKVLPKHAERIDRINRQFM